MEDFVKESSVVRKIWGKPDTILFIFAGSAAEFALNKAVDWLFFTGRLPADPLGRLFSTVAYARQIVFSNVEQSHLVIDRMFSIHSNVEASRGYKIPSWAYRDVLYMLIDYSIRSFELLERKLSEEEKEEVFDVFRRVGDRMQIPELPKNFHEWNVDRLKHMQNDLEYSHYTAELYQQYKKHLGGPRYMILRAAQGLLVPEGVKTMLKLKDVSATRVALSLYKQLVKIKLDWLVKDIILPAKYNNQVRSLDVRAANNLTF